MKGFLSIDFFLYSLSKFPPQENPFSPWFQAFIAPSTGTSSSNLWSTLSTIDRGANGASRIHTIFSARSPQPKQVMLLYVRSPLYRCAHQKQKAKDEITITGFFFCNEIVFCQSYTWLDIIITLVVEFPGVDRCWSSDMRILSPYSIQFRLLHLLFHAVIWACFGIPLT